MHEHGDWEELRNSAGQSRFKTLISPRETPEHLGTSKQNHNRHLWINFFKNILLNVELARIQSCKKDRVCWKMHIPIVSAMVGTFRLIMANNWLNQRKLLRNFQYFPRMIILGYLGLKHKWKLRIQN